MISAEDKKYMRLCFKLAKKGRGYVSPNPMVGCVIVKNGKVISQGWHARFGQAHAEAVAFAKAEENVKDATLYCNLEPCFHTNKKTPPCTPLVVNSGVKRVVLANTDPNPLVAGKSINYLREKGIDVVENVLADEGYELNRFFFKHIIEQKPWITLKIAQTVDGRIAAQRNKQTWITGSASKKLVHALRAEYDAVLVGAGTVRADNPKLNVRKVRGRNPVRIVISSEIKMDNSAFLFRKNSDTPVWIFHSKFANPENIKNFNQHHIKLVECSSDEKMKIDLSFVIDYLGRHGIASLLIEGGQSVFSEFIEQNLYNEIIILQAAKIWGTGLKGIEINKEINLHLHDCKSMGDDCYINLRKKY